MAITSVTLYCVSQVHSDIRCVYTNNKIISMLLQYRINHT